MAYRDFKSLVAKIQNELEYAVVMRIQALFMKEKPSWNLVMDSSLQVVDAFYTSLQIRCTAHNLRIAEVTEYKITYQKGPTFSFTVYCCTQRVGWRSQRQSEKVNIRNACILPVRAKCGRFCVLMIGRVFGHRKSFVLRTAATVHPPYWQNGGSYSPDLTATDWLLVPANAKAGSAARSSNKIIDPSPRGSQDTRGVLPQPSLAACVRRRP